VCLVVADDGLVGGLHRSKRTRPSQPLQLN
jgi:hypothetical protein